MHNKPLKFSSATKCVAFAGLANARRLAERYLCNRKKNIKLKIVIHEAVKDCLSVDVQDISLSEKDKVIEIAI